VNLQGLLVSHTFVVIDGLNYNILLGMQFLQEAHCKLDLDYAVVSFYDGLVLLPLYGKSRNQNVVRSLHSVDIPAATEAIINVSIPKDFRSKTALLEPYTGNTSRPFSGC